MFLQKKLVIQGKTIAMHYSNPRPKFEDWLCNKVSLCRSLFYAVTNHSLMNDGRLGAVEQ